MYPTKQSINAKKKKKLTNIKDPYKKSKNSKKSGPSPQFFSFYDELDEI